MNLQQMLFPWRQAQGQVRGLLGRMFNLNDPRWGRDEGAADGNKPGADSPAPVPPPAAPVPPPPAPSGNRGQGANQGPPDLDELWRDFNRKLGKFFGGGYSLF